MLNMQNVKDIEITEGNVRTIHDKDSRLIWGRVAYNTKYAGDTIQNGTPTPDTPIPVQVVTGEQTVTVSDGVDSEDFTISLGTIELCKIGTHQDYIYKSGDDWYVHKTINSTAYQASEVALEPHNYTNVKYATIPKRTDSDAYGAYGQKQMLCTRAAATGGSNTWDSSANIGHIRSGAETINYWVGFPPRTILETMQGALNGAELYYLLKTPTDTKITNATLISQLNAVHEWLTRYGYNATVAGNLPIIISKTNL